MTQKTEVVLTKHFDCCMEQIENPHYPLVDENAALHQFYGYLVALEQMRFIDEKDISEWMDIAKNDFATIQKTDALRKGVAQYGIPKEI